MADEGIDFAETREEAWVMHRRAHAHLTGVALGERLP